VSSLGFSNLTNKTIRSLQDLLRAIQPLQLNLYESKNLPEERWLGHGASYNVWKCLNRSSPSKEAVAIKKVKLPKGTDDFEAFQSRVACVLKDIVVMNHPPLAECEYILNLLGYGWNLGEGSIPFLVTEFAPGRTLRQFLQENPDTSGMERVSFCRNVIDGLSELHRVGVIHGDLKLDNVLVVGMKAKISDFGHSLLMTPADEEDARQVYRGTEL
jgi:serine/threonine protein kinase